MVGTAPPSGQRREASPRGPFVPPRVPAEAGTDHCIFHTSMERCSIAGMETTTGQPTAVTGAAALPPLLRHRSVAAVCAHPDDESFGLGAVISGLVDAGSSVGLVCLSRGERSTLGAALDLASRRTDELRCAAAVLGIERVTLRDHGDGSLPSVPLDRLSDDVVDAIGDAEMVLTFDHGGVTGHPDHQRATDAAIAAARHLDVPVLGWAIPAPVAATLSREFGAPFVGRHAAELDLRLHVDRERQRRALGCHASQDNPVPRRRIELLGPDEHLRVLHDPTTTRS